MTDLNINPPITRQLLEEGIDAGLHARAQIYISRKSDVIADDGIGESRPDIPMDCNTINLWLSTTKPITAILFAHLWERGEVQLDSKVSDVIPKFAVAGKSAITFRHILTHTEGFRNGPPDLTELDWQTAVTGICGVVIEEGWVPGERAGYRPVTSWYILSEAVSRIVNAAFLEIVRDRLFDPLSMDDSWIGIPPDGWLGLWERIGWVYRARRFVKPDVSYNAVDAMSHIRPGGNGPGPICELGKFYEMLLAGGSGLIEAETIAHFTARHREGLFDHTFEHLIDWGLGFMINSNHYDATTLPYSFGLHASADTFGTADGNHRRHSLTGNTIWLSHLCATGCQANQGTTDALGISTPRSTKTWDWDGRLWTSEPCRID